MKIRDAERVRDAIKEHLKEYLIERGIKIEGNKVQCINHAAAHNNGDANASAAFLPQSNNTQIFCFTENRPFDIFDAYCILENKTMSGRAFWDTLAALADKYHIPYAHEEDFSPKAAEHRKQQELLETLHKISISHAQSGVTYYKERGLTVEKIKFFKVGFFSPDCITKEMDKEAEALFDHKLSSLVNFPSLVIPAFNEYNQYTGLIFRQFGSSHEDKYVNLFLKKEVLYNSQNIKSSDKLYIVEGSFDGIALYPDTSFLSVCTSAINDTHLEFISKKKIKHVIVALDGDSQHQKPARDGILRTILKLKNLDASIAVIMFPVADDPDSFIKREGMEAFKKLPKISAIDYLLECFNRQTIDIQVIYDFISGQSDILKKEKLITAVAQKLDLGKKQIIKALETVGEKTGAYNLITYVKEKEYVENILEEFTNQAWNREFKGISSGFPLFDKVMGGFEDTFYMFIGLPEGGKTATALNLIYNLLKQENTFVAFYSLDDGLKRAIIPRFMSMFSSLPSKDIKYPAEADKDQWQLGMNKFMSLKDRFALKDGADIRTVNDLETYQKIHYKMAQDQGKKFIMVIDNIHALTSSAKFEAVENTQRVASFLKRLPQIYNCPVIATAEVPKSSAKRPSGRDIKESIDLWYAARFVGGLYTDFFEKSGDSNLIWKTPQDTYAPIIEMYVSKNQTGDSWHGSLFYKLYPQKNSLIECNEDETAQLRDGNTIY